jgi:rRNA biogenesis protein RRP5
LRRKLSSKKTKATLKKWLAFEKTSGDEAGVEAVKQRAVDYVAQLAEPVSDEDGNE